MKPAAFLTILTLALIFLGFLINDSIRTRSELTKVSEVNGTLQKEKSQLVQQVAEQQKVIQTLQSEKNILNETNQDLTKRIADLESQIQSISTELLRSQTENTNLRALTTSLASNRESSLLKSVLFFTYWIGNSNGNSAMAIGIVPAFLLGSGILTYNFYRHKLRRTKRNTFVIEVSKEELDAIIRCRRAN